MSIVTVTMADISGNKLRFYFRWNIYIRTCMKNEAKQTVSRVEPRQRSIPDRMQKVDDLRRVIDRNPV